MKKITLIIALITFINVSYSQTIDSTYTHTDSVNIEKIDNICTNKAAYIGQPLSLLFNDFYRPFDFGIPDNLGGCKSCIANIYFKDFRLYLPAQDSDGVYSLTIHLVNKFYLPNQIYQAKRKEGYLQLNDYLESIIKNEIVADITKH